VGVEICWDLIDFQPNDFLNHSSFVSFSCPFFPEIIGAGFDKKGPSRKLSGQDLAKLPPCLLQAGARGQTLARCQIFPRAYQRRVWW
jgi:hypothetical protein